MFILTLLQILRLLFCRMAAAINESTDVHLTTSQLKTLNDFYILNEIGEGSYSTVMLASTKETHTRYALKMCSKMRIQREKKVCFRRS